MPPSPLDDKVFGEYTDNNESPWPWRMKPRWVNSGFIMGSVHDMRAMYAGAMALIPNFNHGGSDQLIFAKMFGEQWYQRHVMSEALSEGPDSLKWTKVPTHLEWANIGKVEGDLIPMERLSGEPLEYAIGLDYTMQLSQTQVYSEHDSRFLVFNDSASLAKQQELTKYELNTFRYGLNETRAVLPLSPDIASLATPFAKLDPEGRANLQDSWNHVPLFTNIFTGNTPVTIHMNGIKANRQKLWVKMWYHDHLQELVKATIQERRVGAYDDDGNFMPWMDICGPYRTLLYTDG